MAALFVEPQARPWLSALGLCTCRDFLTLSGVVVSGHPKRHVVQVQLDGATVFLKKELQVSLSDRFRNWCHGHGRHSLSVREFQQLRQLRAAGLSVPEPLAA